MDYVQRTLMSKTLFILSYTFDDGFDHPEMSFWGTSRVQVIQWIRKEMENDINLCLTFRRILSSMTISDRVWSYDVTKSHEDNETSRMVFLLTRTSEELLKLIDDSYVNGDSTARVTLCEVKPESIIDLTKKVQEENTDGIKVLEKAEDVVKAINCAFHDYCVSHLKWNGKCWYSHTVSTWRDERWVPIGEVGEHDPDHVCYGYWCHVWDANAEDKDGDPSADEVPPPYTTQKVAKVEDFEHVFVPQGRGSAFQLDEVVRLVTPWNVTNDMGMNCDHRGSNHLGIYIEHLHDDVVEIPAGDYKFSDLANLLWRLKGNKFDNQYEMVCTVDRENVDFQDGTMYVSLPVDHGS